MKKFFSIFTFFLSLTFVFPINSLANSGPVYWEGKPTTDTIVINENSPVIIEREELLFDFTESENFIHSGEGTVRASYEMYNPTENTLTVPMVFPLVGSLFHFSSERTTVSVNGEKIPYDMRIGRALPYENKKDYFRFDTIIEELNKGAYEPVHFSEDMLGTLYTFHVSPASLEGVNFIVDFFYDSEKTKILSKGFNGYSKSNERMEISAFVNQEQALQVFVLGKSIQFDVSTSENEEATTMKYDLFSEEISLKDYLSQSIKEDSELTYGNTIPEGEIYNLYVKAIDKYFSPEVGYATFYDIQEQGHDERILALLYEVSFEANSKQTVTVDYQITGGMDRRETPTPLFTFDYLLNPAKNWNQFKELNITIHAPSEAPYIIDSTIPLQRVENNMYIASLPQLPEGDLTFTLYEHEKVTYIQKVEKIIKDPYFFILLTFAVPFAIISLLLVIFLKRRRKPL